MHDADFAEMAFAIADTLRTAGQDHISAEIYGSIAQTDDPLLREKSLLWACYNSAVCGYSDHARSLLSRIDEPERPIQTSSSTV